MLQNLFIIGFINLRSEISFIIVNYFPHLVIDLWKFCSSNISSSVESVPHFIFMEMSHFCTQFQFSVFSFSVFLQMKTQRVMKSVWRGKCHETVDGKPHSVSFIDPLLIRFDPNMTG